MSERSDEIPESERGRGKSMCFDSMNSSYITCGEYASHTLTARQASSMAKTTAIDSGEKIRAKGVQAVSKNNVKR